MTYLATLDRELRCCKIAIGDYVPLNDYISSHI